MKRFLVIAAVCMSLQVSAQFERTYSSGIYVTNPPTGFEKDLIGASKGEVTASGTQYGFALSLEGMVERNLISPTSGTEASGNQEWLIYRTASNVNLTNYLMHMKAEAYVRGATGSGKITEAVIGQTGFDALSCSNRDDRAGFVAIYVNSSPTIKTFTISGYSLTLIDGVIYNNELYAVGEAVECSSVTSRKCFIARMTSAGVLTIRLIDFSATGNTDGEVRPKAIAVDGNNIYVAGKEQGWPADAFVMKFDKTNYAVSEYTVLFPDQHSIVNDMIWSQSKLVVVGQRNHTNSTKPQDRDKSRAFIAELDTDLEPKAAMSFDGDHADRAKGLFEICEGQLLVGGDTRSFSSDDNLDIFGMKVKHFNGGFAPVFWGDCLDNVAVTWEKEGDDKCLSVSGAEVSGDEYLAFFNEDENLQQYVIGTGLDLQTDCSIDVEFDFDYSLDFDEVTVESETPTNGAQASTLISLLGNDDENTDLCTSEPFREEKSVEKVDLTPSPSKRVDGVEVFPNPSATGTFSLQSNEVVTQVRVYTLTGEEIDAYYPNSTNLELVLPASSAQYVLKVYTQNGSTTRKIIVE